MGKNNIYKKNIYYNILRKYVDWCTKTSYSNVEIRGKENIPSDGAIILSPNHCNTLMDALVVLRSFKDESVFGARADIFNKPVLAKILYFLRILPMVRQRDGLRNVIKNYETQDLIIKVLENDVRFCMYPEGRHRPAHSLLPFGKGIFRLALEAHQKFGDKKPVYIIPVGLEYGDYFRYRTTSLVTFGKPINISDFIQNNPDLAEAQLIEPLRKELSQRMSELITYIKDDEDYEGKWALTRILACEDGKKGDLTDRMLHNKHIIDVIEEACLKDSGKMKEILDDARKFDKKRRKEGISIWSFRSGNTIPKILGKGLIALLGIPYFLFASIICLPMSVAFEVAKKKVKDRAFHNTAGMVLKLVLGTLTFIIWGIVAFCLAWWPVAMAFLILTIPAFGFIYDFTEYLRIYVSDLKLLGKNKLKKSFRGIITDFKNI